eukprot:CAMPEP_0118903160 /NCGR_PEP_ID=MMETSP1166-20130328/8140_1 /TAXON_ID=1104430 /ORGANISM="Chrysoreinhardia sp, Strain CCMP3193" /LENGTH=1126 /DNA_ID=CAMNT_0006842385 /DNA_START=38 /DNA_END=3418 /DNA_ORIENTATION=+
MPRELRPRKAKAEEEKAKAEPEEEEENDEENDEEEEEEEEEAFQMEDEDDEEEEEAGPRLRRQARKKYDEDDDDDESEEAPRRRPRRKAAEAAEETLRPAKRRKRASSDSEDDDLDVEALLDDDDDSDDSDDDEEHDDEDDDEDEDDDKEKDDDEDKEKDDDDDDDDKEKDDDDEDDKDDEEKEEEKEEEEKEEDKAEEEISELLLKPKEAPKKLTSRDAAMTSRRRLRPALVEPGYDLELVPAPGRDGQGSYLRRVEGNDAWEHLLPEIVLLCNEAAWRRASSSRVLPPPRKKQSPPVEAKPLMLEYVSDRIDTDDPIFGYVLRTTQERWLQGFAIVTTFTTWTPYLRFTNTAVGAAVTLDDAETRVIADDDLVGELQACRRAGDFEAEGVVWPKVAEFSLLGSLGFGGKLAKIVLDELASARDRYDYVVLQATDQAVPFYEKLGFARVGAVASFERPKNVTLLDSPENFEPPRLLPNVGAKLYWARRLVRSLLRKCAKFDDDLVFALPVNLDLAPGYDDIVKSPMDLQTMRRKTVDGAEPALAAASYLADDLESDIHLMVDNCTTYNGPQSYLGKYAQRFAKKASAAFSKARNKYPELCCGPLDAVETIDAAVARDFEHAADADDAVLGYVHWTFPDQPVEDQYPSYLMARRLRGIGASETLVSVADDALTAALGAASAAAKALASLPDDVVVPMDLEDDPTTTPGGPDVVAASPKGGAGADGVLLPSSSEAEEPATVEKARPPKKKDTDKAPEEAPPPPETTTTTTTTTPTTPVPPPPKTKKKMPLELALGTGLTHRNAVAAPVAPRDKRIVPKSNVTPRGTAGFTAKVARGGGVEYLGIFETSRMAQDAYDAAKAELADDDDEEPGVLGDYEPTGDHLALRDDLLAAKPAVPEPLPIRAADLGAKLGDTVTRLRELALDPTARRAGLERAKQRAAEQEEKNHDGDDGDDDDVKQQQPKTTTTTTTQGEEDPLAKKKTKKKTKKKKKQPALYNKIVTVTDVPPCYPYTFWFVYQYVPDMEWCHLCPMEPVGVFGPNSKREGRKRWRLVPEGQAREIDVAAARCTPVKHTTVAKTQSADKEIFDIHDPNAPTDPVYPGKLTENVLFADDIGGLKVDAPPPRNLT